MIIGATQMSKEESIRIAGVKWEIEHILHTTPRTAEKVLRACELARTIPANEVGNISDFMRDWIASDGFDPTEIVAMWRSDPQLLYPLVQHLPYWLADASPFMDEDVYALCADMLHKEHEMEALRARISANIDDKMSCKNAGQLRELLAELEHSEGFEAV